MKYDVTKKQSKNDIKEGDVFHAHWKEREYGDQKDHCFEGLLIVNVDEKEKLLIDTFWGINSWDNKKWTYEEAIKIFNLEYYVNLNDIEKIDNSLTDEYDDADLFTLHTQHACSLSCRYWFIKKGAKKSPSKKIGSLEDLIEEHKRRIESSVRTIASTAARIEYIKINGL